MNIQNEIDIISSTYWHKMQIERVLTTEETWGETTTKPVTVATNVKCAYSNNISRNSNQTDSTNNIQYIGKVFCNPDVDVKIGDMLTVTFENGMNRTFKTGEPLFYPSHLEVPVVREDVA